MFNEQRTILTQQEKDLLRLILNDKYSVGAFCGMVTNLKFEYPGYKEEEIIQKALQIRLKAMELTR
jgi:hypothetical protein